MKPTKRKATRKRRRNVAIERREPEPVFTVRELGGKLQAAHNHVLDAHARLHTFTDQLTRDIPTMVDRLRRLGPVGPHRVAVFQGYLSPVPPALAELKTWQDRAEKALAVPPFTIFGGTDPWFRRLAREHEETIRTIRIVEKSLPHYRELISAHDEACRILSEVMVRRAPGNLSDLNPKQ